MPWLCMPKNDPNSECNTKGKNCVLDMISCYKNKASGGKAPGKAITSCYLLWQESWEILGERATTGPIYLFIIYTLHIICMEFYKSNNFNYVLQLYLSYNFNKSGFCWSGAPSLKRSRVCSFQFLPGIASAAFLRSETHRTHEHILLSLFLWFPQLRGPGSCIHFPQEQGGPVIPQGTGFPFRRLLWLAWVLFILRPTISRPVCLGNGIPFVAHDQTLPLSFL
jgi:hypothetical protein